MSEEADLVSQALSAEGLPFWIRSFEETAYDGLFVMQKGWGQVFVPRALFHRVTQLIYLVLKNTSQGALYEDPDQVDGELWEELSNLNHREVCNRTKAMFDETSRCYIVPFFGGYVRCDPSRQEITLMEAFSYDKVDFELALVLLHYLIHAEDCAVSGRWIGEKDLPGGNIFFHGPHQLPTRPLAELFQVDLQHFERAGELLRGKRDAYGDCAYVFTVFPRVPVLVVFWRGDEEFEPKVSFRFDETIVRHFPLLDQVFALCYVVYRHLMAAARRP